MPTKKVSQTQTKSACQCGENCQCCRCSKVCHFFAFIIFIALVAAVGYLLYRQWYVLDKLPYIVSEKSGMTTVNPGPGLVPSTPPNITPPTAPPSEQ